MPLTEDEVRRVRRQLALEEFAYREAAAQSKPSFISWLGRAGLMFIGEQIAKWSWHAIKMHFGLPF